MIRPKSAAIASDEMSLVGASGPRILRAGAKTDFRQGDALADFLSSDLRKLSREAANLSPNRFMETLSLCTVEAIGEQPKLSPAEESFSAGESDNYFHHCFSHAHSSNSLKKQMPASFDRIDLNNSMETDADDNFSSSNDDQKSLVATAEQVKFILGSRRGIQLRRRRHAASGKHRPRSCFM